MGPVMQQGESTQEGCLSSRWERVAGDCLDRQSWLCAITGWEGVSPPLGGDMLRRGEEQQGVGPP